MGVRLLLLIITFSPFWALAQKEVAVSGMIMKYQIVESTIEIELEAPTKGWLGIGFNSKNDIVGSDLLLFHVVNCEAEGIDMYVAGVGDPKEDEALGGSNNISILNAQETDRYTKVKFSIPMEGDLNFDYAHRIGERFWLIMAYSSHDDFGHHSRMRKHVPFSFGE